MRPNNGNKGNVFMSNKNNGTEKYIEVNFGDVFRHLLKRSWIIAIATVLIGALSASFAYFFITPKYKASAMLYVNNNAVASGGMQNAGKSFDISDLNAAKSLVNTYLVILNSRNVLNNVISDADLDYSYKELLSMISAAPVNSTEVFEVVVTSDNPDEAEKIANSICKVLPGKIANIVESSSVRIVDYAVVPESKSSPNVVLYAIVGMVIGFFVSCIIIAIRKLLDKSIQSEDYLVNNYNFPVLAVVPDLNDRHNHSKDYYYYGRKDGKGDE